MDDRRLVLSRFSLERLKEMAVRFLYDTDEEFCAEQ